MKNANIGVYRRARPEHYRDTDEYDDLLFNNAISELRDAGANIIDDIEIPSFHRDWGCNKLDNEFKHGVDNFLHTLPSHMPVHTYAELVEWNEENAEKALKYGQDSLKNRVTLENPLKNPNYILESLTDLYYSQNEGVDYTF